MRAKLWTSRLGAAFPSTRRPQVTRPGLTVWWSGVRRQWIHDDHLHHHLLLRSGHHPHNALHKVRSVLSERLSWIRKIWEERSTPKKNIFILKRMLDEDKWLVKQMESSAKQQIELIHLMCGNYACDLSTATQVGQGLSNTECMKLGWLYAWMLWCGMRIRANPKPLFDLSKTFENNAVGELQSTTLRLSQGKRN